VATAPTRAFIAKIELAPTRSTSHDCGASKRAAGALHRKVASWGHGQAREFLAVYGRTAARFGSEFSLVEGHFTWWRMVFNSPLFTATPRCLPLLPAVYRGAGTYLVHGKRREPEEVSANHPAGESSRFTVGGGPSAVGLP
jgi:hypothetical protein